MILTVQSHVMPCYTFTPKNRVEFAICLNVLGKTLLLAIIKMHFTTAKKPT
jgi:hypothetical protein